MVFSMRLRATAIVTVTALLLSGLYLEAAHFAPPDLAVGPQHRSYRLNIGEEKADVRVLEARQGDRITFVVTSTRAGQFYVHGPEVQSTLLPGVETSLTFTAQYSGRYYAHFHEIICTSPHDTDLSHLEAAVLDVMPN
jgi:heme/copper-type cytochrome/quinol oxidase subunit 2